MPNNLSMTRLDVWRRLEALSFDVDGAALPFSTRLARDNGWKQCFAERAIEEYRRFAYLSVVSTQPVTPSDEVDQVWHLHLCYTRHYWGAFKDALGQPLHHGPTEGGAAQGQLFREQYDATRDLYRSEFGENPPADLWPSAAVRFGKAPTARRVLTADHWVVRKPSPKLLAAGVVSAVALAVPAVAAVDGNSGGIGGLFADRGKLIGLGIFVSGAAFLIGIFAFVAGATNRSGRKDGTGCGGGTVGDGDSGGDGGSGCGGGCGGCGGG